MFTVEIIHCKFYVSTKLTQENPVANREQVLALRDFRKITSAAECGRQCQVMAAD